MNIEVGRSRSSITYGAQVEGVGQGNVPAASQDIRPEEIGERGEEDLPDCLVVPYGNNFHLIFAGYRAEKEGRDLSSSSKYLALVRERVEWQTFIEQEAELITKIFAVLQEMESYLANSAEYKRMLIRKENQKITEAELAAFERRVQLNRHHDQIWAKLNPLLKEAHLKMEQGGIPITGILSSHEEPVLAKDYRLFGNNFYLVFYILEARAWHQELVAKAASERLTDQEMLMQQYLATYQRPKQFKDPKTFSEHDFLATFIASHRGADIRAQMSRPFRQILQIKLEAKALPATGEMATRIDLAVRYMTVGYQLDPLLRRALTELVKLGADEQKLQS